MYSSRFVLFFLFGKYPLIHKAYFYPYFYKSQAPKKKNGKKILHSRRSGSNFFFISGQQLIFLRRQRANGKLARRVPGADDRRRGEVEGIRQPTTEPFTTKIYFFKTIIAASKISILNSTFFSFIIVTLKKNSRR